MPTFEPTEPENVESTSFVGNDEKGEITIQLKPEWKQKSILGRLVWDTPKDENAKYIVAVTEDRSHITELSRNRFGAVLGNADGKLNEFRYYQLQYEVTAFSES